MLDGKNMNIYFKDTGTENYPSISIEPILWNVMKHIFKEIINK